LAQRKVITAIAVIVILIVGVGATVFFLLPRTPTIQLWYNSDGHYGDTEPTAAQVIASSIEKIGNINVQLKSEPWAQYTTDFGNGKLPFFLLGWYPDYFDPDDYASPFLGTAGAASLGSEYSNAAMDSWLANESALQNNSTRAQFFTEIQDKLAADVPYIPLWEGKANIVYKTGINGVYLHPVDFRYFFMSRTTQNSTLAVGTTDRITSLDPASAYDYFSIEIINQLFDNLLDYNPVNQTLIPGLATAVPTVANNLVSPDLKTWTYNLRPGLQFSDGETLNSTTVKNSIVRAIGLNIAGSGSFLLSSVGELGNTTALANANISTPSATQIVFHLMQPVSFFNLLMAFSVSAPVPASYSTTAAEPDGVGAGKTIGDGPYSLTSYTAGQSLVLTKNAKYAAIGMSGIYAATGFPSVPIINQVSINSYATATDLKNALLASTGGVDMAYRTLNPADITDLQNRASTLGLNVKFGSSPQIRYLVFNVKMAPFNNLLLRQAIAYAVDRSLIASNVFNNQVDALWSMIPPLMPYSIPVFQTVYGSSPNLTQAQNLLPQVHLSIYVALDVARKWF
jgi:peptide/nickel transport system substrate-binding protein